MAKRKQGIEFTRLINPEEYKDIIEVIKCKICFQILINPVDCDICQHSFCYDCIEILKSENKPCPFGCELKSKNTSSIGIKSILSILSFTCLNLDCKEEISYSDIIIHDKTCKYLPLLCPNCNLHIKSFELEDHVKNICELRVQKCELCYENINFRDLNTHKGICGLIYNSLNGKEVDSLKESIYPGAEFVKNMLVHVGRMIDSKNRIGVNSNQDLEDKLENVTNKLNTIIDIYQDNIKENISSKNINENLNTINSRLDRLESLLRVDKFSSDVETRNSFNTTNTKILSNHDDNIFYIVNNRIDNLENKFTEVSYDLKIHLENSFKKEFEFVWCTECKKIENGMCIKSCTECSGKFCKDCGLKCKECQKIFCEKCVSCPRCKEKVCLDCRKSCSSCKIPQKYCKKCLTECKNCKNINCIDCLKTCSKCNFIICNNNICSNTCRYCSKSLCKKCQKLTENPINQCQTCKTHYSCRDCYTACLICKNQCCKNCLNKCKKCNKALCKACSRDCPSCKENYCEDCSKKAFNSKCVKCGKFFCNSCEKVNTSKCYQCKETNCKTCLLLCGNCNMTLCVKDIDKCKQCNGNNCKNCIIVCQCGEIKFCQNCKMDVIPIYPHQCNLWLNESSYFTGVKTRSKRELPSNFEAKLFIEKLKGDSVSVGITDNNSFQDNSIIFVDQIWTLRLKTGMKYSTGKSVENYLKTGAKEYDIIYVKVENSNLYFKINNDHPVVAYTIDTSKKYYLYIENEEARKECKISLIYIIKI